MTKNKKLIGLLSAVIVVIAVIGCIFAFKTVTSADFSKESVQKLLNSGSSVNSFKTENNSADIIIKGSLDEKALISLSKDIKSMKNTPEIINISITNADSSDFKSFYTEGITLSSVIDTKKKSAHISSFKKSELTKDYNMNVSDYKYDDVENTDKNAVINITSEKITEENSLDELTLFAKVVKNLNSDLENVIVNCTVSDKTYSISLKNENILKVTEQHKL